MPENRSFDEDVLVRAVDYCRERNIPLGRFLVMMAQESFPWKWEGNPSVYLGNSADNVLMMLFQATDETLEALIKLYLEKHQAEPVHAGA